MACSMKAAIAFLNPDLGFSLLCELSYIAAILWSECKLLRFYRVTFSSLWSHKPQSGGRLSMQAFCSQKSLPFDPWRKEGQGKIAHMSVCCVFFFLNLSFLRWMILMFAMFLWCKLPRVVPYEMSDKLLLSPGCCWTPSATISVRIWKLFVNKVFS